MGMPVAKEGDRVLAVDTHIVLVPVGPALVPTPLPHVFTGVLNGGLAPNVKVDGKAVAVVGSTAENQPQHIPTPPGTSFQKPPANKGTVQVGSATVLVGGKGIARMGDIVTTCNDPADMPAGKVIAVGMVTAG